MKKLSLLLTIALSIALSAIPAFAVSDGEVWETETSAVVFNEFVESPSREEGSIPEQESANPASESESSNLPKSPQTGTDRNMIAFLTVAFGIGGVGMVTAGRKKEKAF